MKPHCRYIGSDWMECNNGNVMEQRRARMFVSINLCVDLACTLFIQSTYPLHRESIIMHQPNSIDVVITTPRGLGRWSHTHNSKTAMIQWVPSANRSNRNCGQKVRIDQSRFCCSRKILIATNLADSQVYSEKRLWDHIWPWTCSNHLLFFLIKGGVLQYAPFLDWTPTWVWKMVNPRLPLTIGLPQFGIPSLPWGVGRLLPMVSCRFWFLPWSAVS